MSVPRSQAGRQIGAAALAFSVLYFLSDVIEALQGGEFSDPQLWLTLVAEAAIPFFVLGLYLVQREAVGRLGQLSAWGYAIAYVFFTYTVVYALVEGVPDYDSLSDDLGLPMTLAGALMLVSGLGFGWAVARAKVLPAWTGIALGAGVILVVASQGAPEGLQLVAAGVRDLAFAGMGAALLASSQPSPAAG
jgi:hypothetical protein